MGKLRAKEHRIELLEEKAQDLEVTANDKVAKTREKLANTEKTVAEKIEKEYSQILDNKHRALQVQNEARKAAEQNVLKLEADMQLQRNELEQKHE